MGQDAANDFSADIVILRDGDELVGIGSLFHDSKEMDGAAEQLDLPAGDYETIFHLATKRPGYGRQILNAILDQSEARNAGIYLTSTYAARSFYEAVGFDLRHGIYYLEPGKRLKPKASKAIDNEPEHGVFACPPDHELAKEPKR